MFVGQTGVGRVIERTCEVMQQHPDADPREYGAVPLDLIQKYINFWVSSSTDLYGSEISSNAANYFSAGLKGRAYEEKKYEDHKALDGSYHVDKLEGGRLVAEEVPLRNAMNEVLRSEYLDDNQKGVDYWNRIPAKFGIDFEFRLPHRRFNRSIGMYAGLWFDLEGNPVSAEEFEARKSAWLPTPEDKAYVKSLMVACTEPGKFAGWIAPPKKGINQQALDFEYVKL